MPVKWNAEMDQRLLLLIISMITINWTRVAARWAEVYGQQDGQQPTKKAIIEHIAKLRKIVNGGNASPSKTTGGPSSSASFAPGSSTPKFKIQKNTPASSSKAKGKAKQNVIDSDSDSDDSETKQKPAKKEVKKEEAGGADQESKPLFGEIEPSSRVSLPRTARPAPGSFMRDYAASLDSDFVMADVYDSDDEDDLTVQNNPTGSPAPALETSTVSAFVDDPVSSTPNTPAATPSPAPRTTEVPDDEDDCIVLPSPSKQRKDRK